MLRKLLILSVLLFTFIFASAAVAAEQIRIGIVVGQATAELSCEDEFTVRDSSAKLLRCPRENISSMRSRESFSLMITMNLVMKRLLLRRQAKAHRKSINAVIKGIFSCRPSRVISYW